MSQVWPIQFTFLLIFCVCSFDQKLSSRRKLLVEITTWVAAIFECESLLPHIALVKHTVSFVICDPTTMNENYGDDLQKLVWTKPPCLCHLLIIHILIGISRRHQPVSEKIKENVQNSLYESPSFHDVGSLKASPPITPWRKPMGNNAPTKHKLVTVKTQQHINHKLDGWGTFNLDIRGTPHPLSVFIKKQKTLFSHPHSQQVKKI